MLSKSRHIGRGEESRDSSIPELVLINNTSLSPQRLGFPTMCPDLTWGFGFFEKRHAKCKIVSETEISSPAQSIIVSAKGVGPRWSILVHKQELYPFYFTFIVLFFPVVKFHASSHLVQQNPTCCCCLQTEIWSSSGPKLHQSSYSWQQFFWRPQT